MAEARRSYEIAQSRYRVGLTDLLTVLNTENALFPAEDALVQVRLAHEQALVGLFGALGGGWTAREALGTPQAMSAGAPTGADPDPLRRPLRALSDAAPSSPAR